MSDLRTWAPDEMFKPTGENLVFELTQTQYNDLKRSIAERGYLASCPVVVSAGPFGQGRILDGFHRTEVCADLGIEPVIVYQAVQDEHEFNVLSIELNASRRQMTGAQIIYLRNKHRKSYDAYAKRLMVEGGRVGGQGGKGQANLPEALSGQSGQQTRDRIAAGTGIKSRTAQKLMTVFDEADEATVQAVLAGTISADRAFKKVRPPSEQDALDTSIESETTAAQEIAETVALLSDEDRAETEDSERQRAAGDAVRLAAELDKHIRVNGLMDQDILEYRDLPHTFAGTARRLADWLDLTAEVLELNRRSR